MGLRTTKRGRIVVTGSGKITFGFEDPETGLGLFTRYFSARELGLAHIRRVLLALALGLFLGALAPLGKLLILWGAGGYTVHAQNRSYLPSLYHSIK